MGKGIFSNIPSILAFKYTNHVTLKILYPPASVEWLGDFGVPIAIFIMIALDIIISDAYTQVWQKIIIWCSLLLQVLSIL